MKMILSAVVGAALFAVLGSRLELARVEQARPRLTPAACQLYIDSHAIGAFSVELPIAIEQPVRSGSVVQEVQAQEVEPKSKRGK